LCSAGGGGAAAALERGDALSGFAERPAEFASLGVELGKGIAEESGQRLRQCFQGDVLVESLGGGEFLELVELLFAGNHDFPEP